MNFAKVLRWTLLGLGGLVGCAIIAIAFYLWSSSRPTDAARELSASYAARPAAPDAQNAWFYLWGMGAPADVDPLDLGRQRAVWLQAQFQNPEIREIDPGARDEHAESLRSPAMQELHEACLSGAATPCTLAFERLVSSGERTALEERQLARYRELVSYPRYYEVVPFAADQPLIPIDHAFDGQQLQFVELARLADRGEAEQVASGLERDVAFWREMQRSADTLLAKMFANAALRRHFFFANRILRRLPSASVGRALPASWRQPFGADELSMLRVFAGEYEFAARTARREAATDAGAAGSFDFPDDDEEPDVTDRITDRLRRTLISPQRSLNRIAADYWRTAREFRAPLHEYRAINERLARELPDFKTLRIGGYVARVATSEGLRRAALLAAELRARNLPRDAVAAAVAASDLVDPFTRQPFLWNPQDATLTFEAPRANGRNRIQAYLL